MTKPTKSLKVRQPSFSRRLLCSTDAGQRRATTNGRLNSSPSGRRTVRLDTSRPEVRDTIRRLASTAIEVMFTERFVRLAKPGGLIAVIVPESIVASDRLGPFRIWLLGRMDLLASVSLPQKVFTGVGANAKTSIVFARRLASRPARRLVFARHAR